MQYEKCSLVTVIKDHDGRIISSGTTPVSETTYNYDGLRSTLKTTRHLVIMRLGMLSVLRVVPILTLLLGLYVGYSIGVNYRTHTAPSNGVVKLLPGTDRANVSLRTWRPGGTGVTMY